MKHSKIYIALLLTLLSTAAMAQKPNGKVRDGNRQYKHGHYDRAEIEYRKALEIDSTYQKSHYNLGNTMYRNKNYSEAARQYNSALESTNLTSKQRSMTLHNLGNSYLQQGLADRANGMENFKQAVGSYQEALKLDPSNDDTRYNLSYAMKMLQQAQQQQQGGGQNNDNQQGDQNKQQNGGQDQQKQQQNQQDQQQGQQNQQEQQQNQRQDQQQNQNGQQNKDEQQRKQDAERLLEAVKNNERQTMKEQQRQLKAAKPIKIDKDW